MRVLLLCGGLLLCSCKGSLEDEPERRGRWSRAVSSSTAGVPSATPAPVPMPPEKATSSGPFPATPPGEPGVLVVVEPSGALCVLDGGSGALRLRIDGAATDVIEDRSAPGRWVALFPAMSGGESEGKMVRLALQGAGVKELQRWPFDGEDGRLLDAAEALVGLRMAEGATVFRAVQGEGSGRTWGAMTSVAVVPQGPASVELYAAGPEDGGQIELRRGVINEQGVPLGARSWIEAGEGIALFQGRGRTGWVQAGGGRLRVRWPGQPLDGVSAEDGGFVRAARWVEAEGALVAITGPAPTLRVWQGAETWSLPLGEEAIDRPSWPEHELAYDPGARRLWVLTRRTLRGVALEQRRVVAEGACRGVSLARVEAP
ncbi:MAG: hypothetical protein MUF64_19015 [Polyangiaceae bacterium]|nr:hypothetical protein [Polyangiaceae bacterium]